MTRGSLALVPCASRFAHQPCDNCVPESECHLRLIMLAVRDATALVLDRLTLADPPPREVSL
jgi:DNA-binding IscR family transcriptional regulator